MSKRFNQRVRASLPIRVSGNDSERRPFVRLAHTLDVSPTGARIAGVYVPLAVDDLVEVQCGLQAARFRVAWKGKLGSNSAGRIGLEMLEPVAGFWGIDFSEEPDQHAARGEERRKQARFDCQLWVDLRTNPYGRKEAVRCTDISSGGCYLETWSQLSAGSAVYLSFRLPDSFLRATGEVRVVDASFGVGVQFTQLQSPELLDAYLSKLQQRTDGSTPEQKALTATVASDSSFAETCVDSRLAAAEFQPHVLLAEDSKFLRSAYALYLRRNNFQVITADDGYEALDIAAREHPNVIVLDLLMPRMGGVGALKLLKHDPATASIPVIVLSGLPSSNESKLVESGAYAYLAKTEVGPEALPKYVQMALQSSAAILEYPPATFQHQAGS